MIKFMAWEGSFKASVMAVRNQEAAILKHIIWWQALFVMLLFSGPVMMAVAVFAVSGLTVGWSQSQHELVFYVVLVWVLRPGCTAAQQYV